MVEKGAWLNLSRLRLTPFPRTSHTPRDVVFQCPLPGLRSARKGLGHPITVCPSYANALPLQLKHANKLPNFLFSTRPLLLYYSKGGLQMLRHL